MSGSRTQLSFIRKVAIALVAAGFAVGTVQLGATHSGNWAELVFAEKPQPLPAAETAQKITQSGETSGGYGVMKPKAIFRLAEYQANQAASVRVTGSNGKPGAVLHFDIRVTCDGRAKGIISSADGKMRVIRVDGQSYFKPGPRLLDHLADGDEAWAEQVAGRWMEIPAGSDLGERLFLLEFSWHVNGLLDLDDKRVRVSQVEGKMFDGRRTIGLRASNKPNTAYVSADGSGQLVGFLDPDEKVVYSDWDESFRVPAPADAVRQEDQPWAANSSKAVSSEAA